MKIATRIKNMIFAVAMLACVFATSSIAQQPQTASAVFPPYNVKYVQGVGLGYWPTKGTGLTLNLTPGTAICSSVPVTYAGGTLSLTNNSTNYIYLNTSASCVPAPKTSTFVSADIPIAIVTTASGAITGILDLRGAPTNISSFNPAIPGVIGGTTPNIINLTQANFPEQGSAPPSVSATTTVGAVTANHWLEFYPSIAAGPLRFAGISGTLIAGHCLQAADTVGTLVDNGTPCGGGGGSVTSVAQSFTGGLISVSGSPITVSGTLALAVAGISGGVPYFSSASTWASSAALTANLPVIGGGVGSAPTVGTVSGNTTEFGTVTGSLISGDCLKADASGNIETFGSACSAATVTSVGLSFTGGLISIGSTPVTTSGTIAATVTGISGGVPYFSSSSTWASSGALTVNLPVIGGGAGNPPTVGTVSGNTTEFVTTTGTLTNGDCVSIDANKNFIDSGQSGCGGGGAGGTVTSVALAAPTGFTVSGSPVVVSGTLTWSLPSGWTTGSLLLGNGSNSAATLLIGANGTVLRSNGTTASWQSVGSGTVTSFTAGNLAPLFTTSVATGSTTPALSFTISNAAGYTVFANCTASPAAPSYCSLIEAMLPNTTPFTDTVNTYGAHLNDFSAATLKLPAVSGFTASATSNIGWNTTTNNLQVWANAANKILGAWTATPITGNCVEALVSGGNVLLEDAGGPCGSGGGATIETNSVSNTSQSVLNFINTSGATGIGFSNPSGGVEQAVLAQTTGNGNAVLTCTSTSPSIGDYFGWNGTSCVNITPGVGVPTTETTSFTVLFSMRGQVVPVNNVGGATTITVPQANSTGFGNNFYTCFYNEGSFVLLVTPTASSITWGGPNTTAMAIQSGATGCINSDNVNYIGRIIQGQVIGVLDQTGVSTVNSGVAQTLVSSVPTSSRYVIYEYISQSAGCTTVGSGSLTSVMTWNDGNGTRTGTTTYTPATSATGAADYDYNLTAVWGSATTAMTLTQTYVACTTGTWTYDIHGWVVRQ